MRASGLFFLTAIVMVGLALAVVAKLANVFDRPEPVKVTEKVVAAPKLPAVLVTAKNIYEGDTIRPGDVTLRPVTEAELADFEKNRADYLPAVINAATYRFASRNLLADQPLRKADLLELQRPKPLDVRLLPGTRAISVAVKKENAAGGLIDIGDWVDVFVTMQLGRTDKKEVVTRSVLLAPRVPVIAKRDTLWTGYGLYPPNLPIQHTLAANIYRAALIDYARQQGEISLVPVSAVEKEALSTQSKQLQADNPNGVIELYFPKSTEEYTVEVDRVAAYKQGDLVIGKDTLLELLGLPTEPENPLRQVEVFTGVNRKDSAAFVAPNAAPEYYFIPPVTDTEEKK